MTQNDYIMSKVTLCWDHQVQINYSRDCSQLLSATLVPQFKLLASPFLEIFGHYLLEIFFLSISEFCCLYIFQAPVQVLPFPEHPQYLCINFFLKCHNPMFHNTVLNCTIHYIVFENFSLYVAFFLPKSLQVSRKLGVLRALVAQL